MTARALARRGGMFPNCELPTVGGSPVELEMYRGRCNLVVVFAANELGTGPTAQLLEELAARQEELTSE
jgi:hypothetical protein